MNAGKVWLVGAGPGDVGLFTKKGMEVLAQAQVVVYDSLVGEGILSMIPETAKTIDVGKRGGYHKVKQEEINQILLREAQAGQRVVRLKGGDPFLFGRGGEELELLEEANIPYEVVPGVTSPLAVPAYNGIPVTHRDYCSSLHIITGHKREGKPYDIDFEALVKTKGTLIFLMGVAALSDITNGLLKAGMEADMPAAILQEGTTARQRRVVATLSTLEEEVKRQQIAAPAIIVVGKVCSLADQFAWYEKLPLAGYKVLLTRPRDLISDMAKKLRVQGAEVLELPAIRTVMIEENEPLRKALEQMETYQWLVFTSPTGVKMFFKSLQNFDIDIRSLGQVRIASMGKGTQKALSDWGLRPDLIPEVFDGEHLARALAEKLKGDEKILIPRARNGNQELTRILGETGAEVDDIATYDTVYEKQDVIDEAAEFADGKIDCAVFTSGSTVRGFAEAVGELDFSKVKAACIGRQTMAEAQRYGMQTRMSEEATMDSLVELVIAMKQEGDEEHD